MTVKKKWKKLFAVVSVTLVLSVCSTISSLAAEFNLGVIRYQQTRDKWCWAASTQMMLQRRTGVYYSQENVCNAALGTIVNRAANNSEAAYGFRVLSGYNTTIYNTPISLATAKSLLNSYIPFYVNLHLRDGGAHAVVCGGYNDNDELLLIDPQVGCGQKFYKYYVMKSGFGFESGRGTWASGYYG